MKVSKILCFLFLFVTTNLFAQNKNSQLTIFCVDHLGHPIEFVSINLNNNTTGITNRNGKFVFKNANSDSPNNISISSFLYVDTSFVLKSMSEKLVLELVEKSLALSEVHIHDSHHKIVTTSLQQSVNRSDIEKNAGNNFAQTLLSMNGLTVLNSGNNISKPVINGLHSNRISIFNNGVKQESQQWGSEHGTEIDPLLQENILVLKGAQAVKYGADAIAGVIITEPKLLLQNIGKSANILYGFNTNGFGNILNTSFEQRLKKIKNIAYCIGVSAKLLGNSATPSYIASNTGLQELNANLLFLTKIKKANFTLIVNTFNSKIGVFKGSHIGNLTDLQYAINNNGKADSARFSYLINKPRQEVSHTIVNPKAVFYLKHHFLLNVSYALQVNNRLEFDNHNIYFKSNLNKKNAQSALQLNTQEFSTNLAYETEKLGHGELGLNCQWQSNTNFGASRIFIPNYQSLSYGSFFTHYYHNKNYSLEFGFRYDIKNLKTFQRNAVNTIFSNINNFKSPSANVGFAYYINNLISLKINSAYAWRAPAINELYSSGLHHGTASIEYGNNTLKPEKAFNNSFIFDFRNPSIANINFEVELYNNYFKNYINIIPKQPATLTIRGAFPTFQYLQHAANIYGINNSLNINISQSISLNIKYNVFRGYNTETQIFLLGLPSDRTTIIINKLIHFKNEKKLELSCVHQWVDKQSRINQSQDYKESPAAYHLISFNSQYNLNNKTKIYLRVSNLLNTTYRDYMNRFRYFVDEPGRNISFTLTHNF